MTVHALSTVILDTRPFDAACIFYESTESAGSFVLQQVCVGVQGRRRLPVSPLMFGGLITATAAAELLGTDLGLHKAPLHQTLTATAKAFNTASGLDRDCLMCLSFRFNEALLV